MLPSLFSRAGSFFFSLLLLLFISFSVSADLMLYPTRLVFENNQRSAQLELINNGNERATYRINIVNRRMSEIGEFSSAETPLPGEQFANALLRYSPKQVVLEPGGSQTIRISLRKPADLPVGEYRSHLQFDLVPEVTAATDIDAESKKLGKDEIGIQLKALIGVSIPVIVRHGETSANAVLSELKFLPAAGETPAMLSVALQRSGNRSIYGDLAVTFTPKGSTREQEISKAGGVAVYVPNLLRRAKMELKPPKGVLLARGTLRVTYRERPEVGGQLLAETAIELP